MTITLKEAKAIVSKIATGIDVQLKTVEHSTFDLDANGKPVARIGTNEEPIRHPVTSICMTLGKVTCSIDLDVGDGSPHTFTKRERAEVEALISKQVGNLIVEAMRKPRTAAEHQAWEAEQLRLAGERARAERDRLATELRAQMTPDDAARVDYLEEHGEHDFKAAGSHLRDRKKLIAAAVKLGTMTEADASSALAELDAWEVRSRARVPNKK